MTTMSNNIVLNLIKPPRYKDVCTDYQKIDRADFVVVKFPDKHGETVVEVVKNRYGRFTVEAIMGLYETDSIRNDSKPGSNKATR